MSSRLRQFYGRFGPVLNVTLLSQACSAAAIVLFPIAYPGVASDSLAIGFQTGTAGFTGAVLGVIYNMAIGRPNFRAWGRSALLAALASPVVAAITVAVSFLGSTPTITATRLWIIAVFAFGGAGLAIGGTYGVLLACVGRPRWLAATTVAPNLSLVLALSLSMLGLHQPPLVSAAVWAAMSWGQALILYAKAPHLELPSGHQAATRGSGSLQLAALAMGLVTSMLFPNLYLLALSALAPGLASIAFLVGRVGTAIVGIGVNSLLLVAHSWSSRPRRAVRAATAMGGVALVLQATGSVAGHLGAPILGYTLLTPGWLLLLVASAIVLRDLNRDIESRALLGKSVVDLALSSVLVIALSAEPSFSGYFGAYSASQAVTLLAAGVAWRARSLQLIAIIAAAVAATAVTIGW